ncbi:hypothetical protein SSX86_019960 [Deinandra increscens subsp. villosa]|uniref:NTF2-related export protein n=1 Tax=Deinandra increscens subsp. villosa TaxID=3103831 RepID=A0AAP0CTL6_9ASTR
MAKSSADDLDLRRACDTAMEGTRQKVILSIRVAKRRCIWGKSGKIGKGQIAKPRVLAVSTHIFYIYPPSTINTHTKTLFPFLYIRWRRAAEMDPDAVAKPFVEHYYSTFDTNRATLANLYQESSMLTFEGRYRDLPTSSRS